MEFNTSAACSLHNVKSDFMVSRTALSSFRLALVDGAPLLYDTLVFAGVFTVVG